MYGFVIIILMKTYTLPEQNGHIVSFSEYGNPNGPAIISFHGGPGSKSKPSHAERFDLETYRIILFDQRGCGKSLPLGGLEHNTTADLLNDAERIREYLGIDRWFVSGGSWGSTLALLYAIQHPERTIGLLLSAVFLADRDSVAWAMEDKNGAAKLMPDVWARRMAFFKRFNISVESQNADILRALDGADFQTQQEIVANVRSWESNLFSAFSPISYDRPEDITEADVASVCVFMHYEMNHEFIPEGHIMSNVKAIEHIPTVIVHGRYDILCPLQKAYELSEKLKQCELVIATSSGHSLSAEGETIQKMAFDRFLERNTGK